MNECPRKSVGAIIKRGGKILLIDRVNEPLGWACPAGHLDAGKTPEEMVRIEITEEVGLTTASLKLVLEEMVSWNNCWRSNNEGHYWRVYEVEAEGEVVINNSDHKEANGYGWFSSDEIQHLNLEPVWRYFFEKLGYISASHKCDDCIAEGYKEMSEENLRDAEDFLQRGKRLEEDAKRYLLRKYEDKPDGEELRSQ